MRDPSADGALARPPEALRRAFGDVEHATIELAMIVRSIESVWASLSVEERAESLDELLQFAMPRVERLEAAVKVLRPSMYR